MIQELELPNELKVIVDGAEPLMHTPKGWEDAELIIKAMNKVKNLDIEEPKWNFDCNFKLDFDGCLMRISSRFYPPNGNYGPDWDGDMDVYFLDDIIYSKKFRCVTLKELYENVESYKNEIVDKIRNALQLIKSA